jgi:hypothetical protein
MIFSIAYWPAKVTRTAGLADHMVRMASEGLDAFRE